jgi:hypothetical protein
MIDDSHVAGKETSHCGPLLQLEDACEPAPMPVIDDDVPDWVPFSRIAGIAWLVVYLLFLLYAAADRTGFLVIDYVNLIIHESGHFFFSWFGHTIMILGGTLGELRSRSFAPPISGGNAKPLQSPSRASGPSKTSSTSAPPWPTPARPHYHS